MTEDGIADGFPGRMSRPEAGATPLTGLLQGQLYSSLKPRYPRRKPSRTLKKISFYDLTHKTNVQTKRSQTMTPLTQWPP